MRRSRRVPDRNARDVQSRRDTEAIRQEPRLRRAAACLDATLTLGACGGGGFSTTGASDMPPDSPPPGLSDSDDPRMARLGELLECADALLVTGLHVRAGR